MQQINVISIIDFGQPISVNIEGVCNHADYETFYIDRDGGEISAWLADYQWHCTELVCNTCDAILRQDSPTWEYEV